jgi:hypothetical protein
MPRTIIEAPQHFAVAFSSRLGYGANRYLKETEISGTVREMVNEAAASADRLYLPVQYKIRTAEQAYTKDGRLKKDGVVAGINEVWL